MTSRLDQILSVEQMRAAEERLIAAGSSVEELMQIAGSGAAQWVWRMAAGHSVTVLCGPGNNGGDGYVIAESLRRLGGEVRVVAPYEPRSPAAARARAACAAPIEDQAEEAKGAVLVDCLFGSGLTRPLSARDLDLLRSLASRHARRIAIDLPSGIESDAGALLNEGLPDYQMTIALGAWKFAHWVLPARLKMGIRRLVDIGVETVEGAARLIARPRIAAPAADTHKYRRGLCALVAGDMAGASLLAAMAATRAGAGYVKLFAERPPAAAPASLVVETGALDTALADPRIGAILVGPGLGRGEGARARLKQALAAARASERAVALDADALHLLTPEMLKGLGPVLATPHDGELERLCASFAVAADGRKARALALAKASGMVVLAKGPDSFIADSSGRLALARPAPSWLSVAGSGDVLAGIAASRMASGAAPFDAACEAVWLHGEAARICGAAFPAEGLARAVSRALSKAVA